MRRRVVRLVVVLAACSSSSAEPEDVDTIDGAVSDVGAETREGDVALDSTAQSDTLLAHEVVEHEVVDEVTEHDIEPDVAEPDVSGHDVADEVSLCPADCDDGDACNGDEMCDPSVGCVSEVIPACPAAPPECGQVGGVGTFTSGRVTAADARPIRLVDDDTWDAMNAIIDLLEAQPTVTPVTLDDVLANLNRVGERVSSVPDVECLHVGFKWNAGDGDVDHWYPQGLTGTADAYAGGAWQGKKVLVSSWYHKPEEEGVAYDKGVRVGFVDVTDLDDIRYRWALLVVPKMQGGQPTFERVPVHAGGLTWYRNYLYVPDTSRGFRVFDMSRILQVQTGRADLIGRHEDGYHAHDYRYVIPQVGSYSLCPGGCCARFSYASLDTTTDPISIVSGEYSADSRAGRLHRWPLDATTGRLVVERGRVQAMDLYFSGVTKVQGGLTWDDRFFLSCSGSDHPLRTGLLGAVLATRDWAYGPEDLHYAPTSDNLWSLSEHPGSRYVFAVKKADMTAGCP